MALLGFASPGGMEAVQREEIQARSIRDRSTVQLATNLFCALMIAAISFGSAPIWAISGWVAMLLGFNILWFTVLRSKGLARRQEGNVLLVAPAAERPQLAEIKFRFLPAFPASGTLIVVFAPGFKLTLVRNSADALPL